MRLGVMQPYFFPYPGHFSLIAHTDAWVVFDITQYTPKTWMNRNRVLHPGGGPNWVSVPLANGSISIRTCEARVLDLAATRESVLGKLTHYRRKAPFYPAVEAIVRETFALPAGDDSLTRLNVRGLDAVCAYLGLPFKRSIASEMALDLPADLGPGDWALAICQGVGAKAYLNPIGGRDLFLPEKFARAGVGLHFLRAETFDYETGPYKGVPGL
ncbi:MAG: WbqC family protein, partial [Pseudomonadota bacterium]|nr:WbqC family protein [Pseudomonadota bacterium]